MIYLAHGASGTAESMNPHVTGLRKLGLDARTVSLPVGKAERAVEAYRNQVADLAYSVIGGHSFGGRVASMLGAQESPKALVLFSYPLHRPGRPEWEGRTQHWESITCPVLFLSGERDAFANIDLLREAIGSRLPTAKLITYPRLGHGLVPVLADALDHVGRFVRAL